MREQMNDEKPKQKPPTIAISDLAFSLGLIQARVERWLSQENPSISYDHMERPCVEKKYLATFANHPEYEAAFRESQAGQAKYMFQTDAQKSETREERVKLLEAYDKVLEELKALHSSFLDRVNAQDRESGVTAAFLLTGRAINLISMGLHSLRGGFFFSGLLLRDIDEARDVARYFIASEGSAEGEADRRRWFRNNITPKHEKCRKVLAAELFKKIPEVSVEDHEALLNELYQKKSKWVHPTYRVIRETTAFNVEDRITINAMDYGKPMFERPLSELADSFRSSILNLFQTCMACFHEKLPLSQEEMDFILDRNYKLLDWEETKRTPELWKG